MNGRNRGAGAVRMKAASAVMLFLIMTICLIGCGSFSQKAGSAEKNATEWFYEQFDKTHRNAYDAFRDSAGKPFSDDLKEITDEEGNTVQLPVSELDSVYQGFLYDHPEMFWLDRTYRFKVSGSGDDLYADAVGVIPLFGSAEELGEYEKAFLDAADLLLRKISKDTGEKEIPSVLYDLLIENTDYTEEALYDPELRNEHTAYGAIAEKSAVCDGFALAYKYLLGRCGIDCIVIPGECEGAAHVWNTVYWDGAWHETDITFDASSGREREYFDLTTEEMNGDHRRETEGIGLLIPVSE